MKFSPSIDLDFIGPCELPEQRLAVAVIERAVCDFKRLGTVYSPRGSEETERFRDYALRTAAVFLFEAKGMWSLEWYCAMLSDDPEDLARRVRRICLSSTPFTKKRATRRG